MVRSLWGTTPIINIIYNSRAERLLGIESDTLVFKTYHITDHFTYNLSHWCRNKFLRVLMSFPLLVWALLRYDIFHFFFDQGILPSRNWSGINPIELMLLRFFGKKLFIYPYGADVRTRGTTMQLGKYHCCLHCPDVGRACVCDEAKHARQVKRIQLYAAEIFSMGDMTEYTPCSNNQFFFWCIDTSKISYEGARNENRGNVKIVHAPNHRHFKGTDYLIKTVNDLKKEGLDIELVLVERMSNDQALEIYRDADIIAEQFLIGWHGFTAIEAMALGKPVISFIRKAEYLLHPEECPIVSSNPDHLEETIRDLVLHPLKRLELGKQGRAYVEKYFSLEAFSNRLRALYEKHGILEKQGLTKSEELVMCGK